MQCFIGGACSGRRALVVGRFPAARWHRLAPGEGRAGWRRSLEPGIPLVVTGWADWLATALAEGADNEAIRAAWRALLTGLAEAERAEDSESVVILDEMGRGVVPMAPEARRLRDLNGWLAQDAAACCAVVWYVRHGLARRISPDTETFGKQRR